jgi:hypothetical protein
MSAPDRKAMLDRAHLRLSVRRQCALLGLHRSGVYRPQPLVDQADLALMRRIDALFLARPYYYWPRPNSRVTSRHLREDHVRPRERLARLDAPGTLWTRWTAQNNRSEQFHRPPARRFLAKSPPKRVPVLTVMGSLAGNGLPSTDQTPPRASNGGR